MSPRDVGHGSLMSPCNVAPKIEQQISAMAPNTPERI
jgi:hypothetical protein